MPLKVSHIYLYGYIIVKKFWPVSKNKKDCLEIPDEVKENAGIGCSLR